MLDRTKYLNCTMKLKSLLLLLLIVVFAACKSDDEPEPDPPVITYTGGTINTTPGSTISISLVLSSGVGLKTLEISQDTGSGAVLLDEAALDQTAMQLNFDSNFDIPANFPTGTSLTIIFVLVDASDRRSEAVNVTVNVN